MELESDNELLLKNIHGYEILRKRLEEAEEVSKDKVLLEKLQRVFNNRCQGVQIEW